MATKKVVKKTTRYDLIAELYNSGVTSIKRIITKIKAAEKKGSLIVKSKNEKNDSFYERNVKWYLGQLNRKGLISGYTSIIGRPVKAKKPTARLSVKAKSKTKIAKKSVTSIKAKKAVKTTKKAVKTTKKVVTKSKK